MSNDTNYGPELFTVLSGIESNSDEWYAWRQARALTTCFASGAAAALGVGKFKPRNRRELYLDKHGLLKRSVYARGTKHGHALEPVARAFLEDSTGEVFLPQTRISECERFVASPDGATIDDRILLEVKCPVSGTSGELWDHAIVGEVPIYYYWQLVQQAALSECEEVWFFVYAGSGPHEQKLIKLNGHELRVAWHQTLKPALLSFLDELKEPIPSGECVDQDFLTIAAELAEAEAALVDLEKRRDAAKEALVARAKELGGEQVRGGGFVVSQATRQGNVNYKALLKAHGIPEDEGDKFRGKSTTYYSVRAAK